VLGYGADMTMCACVVVMPLQVIVPMDAPRILMLEVAEQVAAVTLVSHLPGIQAVSHLHSQLLLTHSTAFCCC
jgi:hypothetical protein